MGNRVGSVLGVVAGAAVSLIPGVGPVAGALIFTATTAAGSGIDALIDTNTQNSEADKAAEENRQRIRREAEIARVAERERLEKQQTTNNENLTATRLEAEKAREAALAKQEAIAAILRNAQQQINLVEESLNACRDENFDLLPGLLARLDNEHFNLFYAQTFAMCVTADALEACQQAIEHEELRREVNNIWENELNPPQPARSPSPIGPNM